MDDNKDSQQNYDSENNNQQDYNIENNSDKDYNQQTCEANENEVQGGYDQQYMNMYGDQSYKTESPEKQKKIRTAIVASVVALVAICVVLLVVVLVIRKSPKKAVELALRETLEDVADNSLLGVLGLGEMNWSKGELSVDTTIDSVEDFDKISGSKFGITAKTDVTKNTFELTGLATIGGEEATATISCVDNTIYLSSPELLSNAFALNLEEVASEMEEKAGVTADSATESGIMDIIENSIVPAVEDFADSIEYERVGKESFTNADGESVKATYYTVTIPSVAFSAMGNALMDAANEYVAESVTDEMLEDMNITRSQLTQLIGMIPSVVNTVLKHDVVVNVYVNGGKLVHLDFSYELASLDVTLDVVADFMGEKNVATNAVVSADLTYQSELAGTFKIVTASAENSNITVTNTNYSLMWNAGDDSEYVSATTKFAYNERNKSFNEEMSAYIDDDTYALNFSGTVGDVDKGDNFDLTISQLSVLVNSDTLFSASGNISANNDKVEIEAPSSAEIVEYSALKDDMGIQYLNKEGVARILSAWRTQLGSPVTESEILIELELMEKYYENIGRSGDSD